MKKFLVSITRNLLMQVISLTILLGLVALAAITWPTSAPTGETGSGMFMTYFDNMRAGTCTGVEVIKGFDNDLKPICTEKPWVCGEDITVTQSGTTYTYGTTKVNGQCWTTQNMKHLPTTGSGTTKCYGDEDMNCEIYGRLYSWYAAMGLEELSTSNSEEVGSICKQLGEGWTLMNGINSTNYPNFLINILGGFRNAATVFGNKDLLGYRWESNTYRLKYDNSDGSMAYDILSKLNLFSVVCTK